LFGFSVRWHNERCTEYKTDRFAQLEAENLLEVALQVEDLVGVALEEEKLLEVALQAEEMVAVETVELRNT